MRRQSARWPLRSARASCCRGLSSALLSPGLLVGYVAEPLVGEALGALLAGTGIPAEAGVAVGTGLALIAATIIQMIVGELYPKNLAIANPEPLSLGLARSTLFYMSAFGWLISFFDRSANLLLKLLRIEPIHDLDVSASATDLPHIIADSRDSGDLPRELSLMMIAFSTSRSATLSTLWCPEVANILA